MTFDETMRAHLSPFERRLLGGLKTPRKIQDYLDTLPINFEMKGETYMSVRRVMRTHTAHCFEGALFAACALSYHGARPLLLDLKTHPKDQDHVVALFQEYGRWGAISKTNHAILRYRDPVYMSVRELAMSYFHEYITDDGEKTLRSYSRPFDLSRVDPATWIFGEEELFDLVEKLDRSRHEEVAPRSNLRLLRRASHVERKAVVLVSEKAPPGYHD